MKKKKILFLFLTAWSVLLYAQSDTTKVRRLHLTTQVLLGTNFTGYYEKLGLTYMGALGLSYDMGSKWSVQSEIRIGEQSYINQLNDDKVTFVADIRSLNICIPLTCSYEFRKLDNKKNISIGVGLGYSESRSSKTDFKTIKSIPESQIYYPIYVIQGNALYAIFKATKFFVPNNSKGLSYFVSVESDLDVLSHQTFSMTSYNFNPSTGYFKNSTFNIRNNTIFFSTGISF